ncbi:hypothetical protein ASF62_05770 [Leifsonia sp. Leaf325]|nr:alpha/beta hydrolase [Leifsonia sp. Leaf325]KQQ93713.1 hypothetical protein ASF62_05770 [Leifsonia sp. Leaf325]
MTGASVKFSRPAQGRPRRRALIALAASATALMGAVVLSGFHAELHDIDPAGSDRASELTTTERIGIRTWTVATGITVEPDITYGTREDGTRLDLDVCSPASDPAPGETRVGIVSIHGGSWARGDKSNDDWRHVCQWLASEGFVAFSVNYRLVPAVHFPAAIDDVGLAVEWVRAHAADYGIDAARIGAFGGSAGGNLAALLGTRGEGALDAGSRVAAVAELSGPIDLTDAAMQASGAGELVEQISLNYLGCDRLADCPQAADASATTFIDPSDPPVFIGHSESEFIPLGQSTSFSEALSAAGIANTMQVVPGVGHSIGILDEAMRGKVADFFRATLTAPMAPVVTDAAPAVEAAPAPLAAG